MDNANLTETQTSGNVNFLVLSDSSHAYSVVFITDLGMGPIRINSGEKKTVSVPVGAHSLKILTSRSLNDKKYIKSLYINSPDEIITVEIRLGGFSNFININSNLAVQQDQIQPPINNVYVNTSQQPVINGNQSIQQPVIHQQISPVQPVQVQPVVQPVQVQPVYIPVQQTPTVNPLLKALAGRITAEGVLWIIVGSLQLLISSIFGLSLLVGVEYSAGLIVSYLFILAIGIVNLVVGIKHCNYARRIKTDCRGVTERYAFKNAIGMYIWNTIVIICCIFSNNIIDFIFAGLIIAVIIVDIAGVRSFAARNQQVLLNLERSCSTNS